MYIRIVLGFVSIFFFTSKYSFWSGLRYAPYTTHNVDSIPSFILRDNNDNDDNNTLAGMLIWYRLIFF